MAATILHTVAARLLPDHPLWSELTQFHRVDRVATPADTQVHWPDRPPMLSVAAYRAAHPSPART